MRANHYSRYRPECFSIPSSSFLLAFLVFAQIIALLPQCQAASSPTSSSSPPLTLSFPDIAATVPPCGLDCVIQLAPNSSCLDGNPQGDALCLCENDILSYYPAVLSCVQEKCSTEESLGEFCPCTSFSCKRKQGMKVQADKGRNCPWCVGGMRETPKIEESRRAGTTVS
ncbi:hypothetical protein B0H66DRAFT_318794 [Apodospora peruviana]|uniref:CFEM domain-containing protein n=1 Tax=Apodospora peruviana TaxID=516989 RepID=A0AAE0HXJ2_9PEZI|nr:hypothetical protein B0H66DRAFT_318794 [Apodospora peruviana]